MFQIRSWLCVGKLSETQDVTLLHQREIGAMLQLAGQVSQPGIASLFLSVADDAPLSAEGLKAGIEFVRQQKAAGRKVLIACNLGLSRSAAFAVAALKEEEGLALLTAFRELHAQHPTALPHPVLWKSLCQYYGEPVSYRAVAGVGQEDTARP